MTGLRTSWGRGPLLALLASSCGIGNLDPIAGPSSNVGLVAHWTFDEGQGTAVLDHSGNKYNGVLTGGAWVTDGRLGGALLLSRGDYVTVPNFPAATASWTVSAWALLTAADIGTDRSPLLSTEIHDTGGWELHAPSIFHPPQFEFSYADPTVADPTTYVYAHCCPIVAGQWTHITAVLNALTSTLTIYQGGTASSMETVGALIQPGDSTLYIGRWGEDLVRLFQGTIDDIRIYDRSLTPQEIVTLE